MTGQPIDPRLEASDGAQAQFQSPAAARHQAAPYAAPAPRSDSQVKLYREAADQVQQQVHPYYYALPPGQSPSDDNADRRESAPGADMVDMSPNGHMGADAKRSRACEACRGLKVRCDMENADQPCKRCAKAGRQCIVTQPSRRRQKKADTRVAELEKKIDALTAVIHAQQQQQPPPMHPQLQPQEDAADFRPVEAEQHDVDFESEERRKRRRLLDAPKPSYHSVYADVAHDVQQRVRHMVDWNSACAIYAHFKERLTPQFPAVVLAPDATPESTLETKPILFLCIMATASFKFVPHDVQDALTDAVFDVLATAVLRKGIKSLEIIQGLQVAFLWHKPPDRSSQANFYMLIHMAAVMALDIGLGKPFNPQKAKRGFGGPGNDLPPGPGGQGLVDSDTVESRRAWLCCYYTSASVAQVLRRPNLLRWSNYMQECVDILESSPDAAPGDRLFTQHVKIQHICDEISVSFAMEDPTASVSILDPKVAYTLDVLETQLRKWDAHVPQDLRIPTLVFYKHVTTLYLNEIGLHVNHNTDDFKVPFSEGSLKSGNHFSQTLTQKQMASIEACLNASHNIISTYCDFGLEAMSALPALLYFVRTVYALVVLIKMHVAATSPGSELGKVIKPEDIKVSDMLDRVFHCFVGLPKTQSSKAFMKAQQILGLLRDWIASHPSGDGPTKDATARAPQPQRFPPRENDSLRVLSEAATAGAERAQQRTNWPFESPYGASFAPGSSHDSQDVQSRAQTDAYSTAPNYASTIMSTPGSIGNQPTDASPYGNMLDPSFAKLNGGAEWTSGMDFEQAIDVALSSLDYSGDLFGSFFGDGAEAFQLPDATAGRW